MAGEKDGGGRKGHPTDRLGRRAAQSAASSLSAALPLPNLPRRLAPISGSHSGPEARQGRHATAGRRQTLAGEPEPAKGQHRQQEGERIGRRADQEPGPRDRRSGPHDASTGTRETIQRRGSNGPEAQSAAHAPGAQRTRRGPGNRSTWGRPESQADRLNKDAPVGPHPEGGVIPRPENGETPGPGDYIYYQEYTCAGTRG